MRVAMASVVGGTASSLGGGKFANGAVSAAFVAMYNEMGHEAYPKKENLLLVDAKKLRHQRVLAVLDRNQRMINARNWPQKLTYEDASRRIAFAETINDKALDIIGLGLSVGSAVSPAGIAVRLGVVAIGIDLFQGDMVGAGIGGVATVKPNVLTVGIDIAYGVHQVVK